MHQHLDEAHFGAITPHRAARLRQGRPMCDTGASLHVGERIRDGHELWREVQDTGVTVARPDGLRTDARVSRRAVSRRQDGADLRRTSQRRLSHFTQIAGA